MSAENINFDQNKSNALASGLSGLISKLGCFGIGCGGLILLVLIVGGWLMSVYNGMVTEQQKVETAWGQVENVYQRRADLIPNLVNTVKSVKNSEIEAMVKTIEARAQATQVKIDPTNMTAEDLQKFQAQQGELSSALNKLMAINESYPDFKFPEAYTNLMVQLEGSENRIATERHRFNEVAKDYNTKIKKFPGNIVAGIFGFKEKPYFKADPGAERAPQVPENF